MKRSRKIILIISGIIVLLLSSYFIYYLFSCNKTNYITDYDYLYDVAIKYLKSESDDLYKDKEDPQQIISYKGFGISEDNNYKYAYMWILEESYYVQNEKLYSGSGSSIPYKFIFKDNKVVKYEIPKDGSYYQPSMKKIFPKDVYDKISKYNINILSDENKKKIDDHYSYLKSTKIYYESSYKYNDFSLVTKNNCSNEPKEYYKEKNHNIYLVCADEFYIKDLTINDEKITFKEYVGNTFQTFDSSIKKLTDELDKVKEYDDGGTTIYKNNDITVVKCNTIDGNKDIFIGDYSMRFDNELMCK